MNPGTARGILGVVALSAVTVAVVSDLGRTAPGGLAAIHERVPELVGRSGCALCHGAARSRMADSCLACHEVVGTQLASEQGLHGTLGAELAGECAACHGEHHGADFRPAGVVAFALAGVPDLEQFDHTVLGIELEGEHRSLRCQACHPCAEDHVPPPGQPRFGGLRWECASCHEDPHERVFGERCASCHGQSDFTDLSNFTHTARFALEGVHAAQECAECHPTQDAHSYAALSRAVTPVPIRECIECHGNPHAESFVNASAALAQTTPGDSCATCHSTDLGDFGAAAQDFHSQQHVASGFPLEVPHDRLECSSCHTANATFLERFPGRANQDCSACHDDPHRGEFEQGPFAAQGCLDCHAQAHFAPHVFGAQLHSLTSFPLTGSHLELDCQECHADPVVAAQGDSSLARQVLSFVNAPGRCEDCHTDVHRGAFDLEPAGLTPKSDGLCAQCHDTQSFHGVAAHDFDHGRWTGFPLEGAHGRADCDTCHTRSLTPQASGRTLGFVADHVAGPPMACAGCHADPHEGAFDDSNLPAAANGRDGCARCHDTQSFSDTAESFEHGLWTGFALEGAHAHAGCLACHPAPSASRATGRVHTAAAKRFGGASLDCASCHRDPHGGEFDRPGHPSQVNGRHGCARCHGTASFRALVDGGFDHGSWTGFALGGGHTDVSCSSCHAVSAQPDELGRTYGRAKGNRCADCHADPHAGQFRSQGEPAACDRCHGVQILGELTFEHQTDSRFQLDGSHAALACAACHKPWPLPGGGAVVRYRPLGRVCTDCHGMGDVGQGTYE